MDNGIEKLTDQPIAAYEGNAPFLFVSYAPDDWDAVEKILSIMQYRGLRFWISAGVKPGMERDEVIASKIEACDYFLAFISPQYLRLLDCTDELNFARDLNKEQVLVYLSDTELSAGMSMRMSRGQSLRRDGFASDEALFDALLNSGKLDRFYGIEDPALAEQAEPLLTKLEAYYPEHRIFALDGLDKELNQKLAILCAKTEFDTVRDLLGAYGYQWINGEEAHQLRSSVGYLPGSEPEIIRRPLANALRTLREYYPEGIVADNLQQSHKALHMRLFALQKWLGYSGLEDFLSSYGFQYLYITKNGRRARSREEFDIIFKALRDKYERETVPKSLMQIFAENPEYKAALKTLQNNSFEVLGCTLRDYLIQEGLLWSAEKEEDTLTPAWAEALDELKARYEREPGQHVSYEEAADALEGICIHLNTRGQLYVFRVYECDEEQIIPWGIDFIRGGAFEGQEDLRRIVLPETCISLGSRCFADCGRLEEVILPEGLPVLEEEVFAGCRSLRQITIPTAVEKICRHAFLDCSSLKEVTILNPRCSVYSDAFEGCPYDLTAGEEAVFSYSVDKKNRATITGFSGGGGILHIPDMLEGHPVAAIAKGIFANNAELREVVMSDEIAAIQGDVFSGCCNLEKLHISNNVSKFTSAAFAGCTSLKEVNIPNAMTELKRGVFKDSPVELLHIGKQTRLVDPAAFYKGELDPLTGKQIKGKSVRQIDISPDNPFLQAEGSLLFTSDRKTLLTDLGRSIACRIPEGVEQIADGAFSRNQFLTSVHLPDTLKHIGASAFAETGLRSIHFPSLLTEIGERAFSFCRDLTEADFSEGLAAIGDQAFEGCPVADISLPASLRQLGSNAFPILSVYQGETAQSLTIAPGNKVFHVRDGVLYREDADGKIAVKAFSYSFRNRDYEAGEPVSYRLETGTTEIGAYAFCRCDLLRCVILPDSIRRVGAYAFWDCTLLEQVAIPPDTEIDPSAFQGCNALIT